MSAKKREKGPYTRIQIVEKVIADSVRNHSGHCMVAESIKAQLPGMTKVAVDIQTIRMTDLKKGLRYTYLTPRVVQEAIIDFDEGQRIVPFSFLLRGAHVTLARHRDKRGGPARPPTPEGQRRTAAARAAALQIARTVPVRAHLRDIGKGQEAPPARVGGDPAPQLSMRREFGLRAFRAASLRRLANLDKAPGQSVG